jgi:hypothetical protein
VALGAVLGWPIGLALMRLRSKKSRDDEERKRFDAPDRVSELLNKIARQRDRVHDSQLQRTLYQCCTDIERYFKQYSGDKQRDTTVFANHLGSVLSVLEKYIEVQDAKRYFNDPDEIMRNAEESINDFAEYVLTSIRNGNDANLIDYTVNTKILQAQRYR